MNITVKLARPLNGERGMALVSALLLLLVISLLAVGLSMDTSMDVRLAGYQRVKARSFGFAESGLMASADILETNIYDAGWDNVTTPFEFPGLSDNYVGTLNILSDGDFFMLENLNGDPTMVMTDDINAEVVVQSLGGQYALGGALQSHAGYAGIGKGAGGGGMHRIYNIEATGTDADNVKTTVAMSYRFVN